VEKKFCAGILFVTRDGRGLFLKRSPEHKRNIGVYGLPGGHFKKGETAKQCAIRECIEEIGNRPEGELVEINRQLIPIDGDENSFSKETDYTTFMQVVDTDFFCLLNNEHTDYTWAPLDKPPEPLHPNLRQTLQKMYSDELGIAEMMMSGATTSPQKYGKMWLFDIRVTGTGLSYRSGLDEFVWRDKSIYLNERFLKRCYGLPVIFEHPAKATLDTKEYVERNIGSIFLPYIKGDEVWCIARIYDDFAAQIMRENQLSTSPAVVLYGDDEKLTNGENTLLIEGKPKLLDHLAICFVGVWDKGEKPTGVVSSSAEDKVMADADEKAAALEAARKSDAEKARKDEFEKEEKEKADAKKKADAAIEEDKKMDSVLSVMDAMQKRMDSWDEAEKEKEAKKADKKARKDAAKAAKADADKTAADAADAKAKKDAEEKEEKEKADAAKAKADAEGDVRKRIADVEARLPKQMTDADYQAMADAQSKADRICLMHGTRAPRPMDGENLLAYRRRLAGGLKEHSPAWKSIDLRVIADDQAFSNVENTIYADAETAGLNPVAPSEDYLREIVEQDVTGRRISKFVGRPSAWMNQFSAPRRRLVGIRNSSAS
jgi:8-oxo-dGTP pyrophosphatase MutT (NUDIX family)